MKKLASIIAALVLLNSAPALAMSCCGGGKGKAAMCSKGGMATNTKGRKGGCCCEGMSGGNMSKRT